MPQYDVTSIVQLEMRITAFSPREAMDIVINHCYAEEERTRIGARCVTVLEEHAKPAEL